jgi:hypothetical protein
MAMRKIMLAGITLVMALVAGCGQSDMMKAMVPTADQQVARHYLDLLRDHQFDPIEAAIDPSIRPPNMHAVLVRMAGEMPPQPPVSVKVIGFNQSIVNAVQSTNVTFEYQYADRWLLENVAIKKVDGVSTIIGLNVKPMASSLEASNRLTLVGKGAAQYLVLVLAALCVGVTLLALVLCARASIARRKWLWILFILVGFGKLSVNWNSGAWSFMPFSVQLFSASAFAPFYGPWIVAVSFPLGAVWFLLRRRALLARVGPPALPKTRAP